MEQQHYNFGALMDRTLRLIKQSYQQTFREHGQDITPEQWVVIDSLAENDGISQTELANGSFKNAPTVSRIIDLLEKKKILTRRKDETDGRQRNIFMTAHGRKLHAQLKPEVLKLRTIGWHNLDGDDFAHFQRMMEQIFRNFEDHIG